MMPTIEAVCHCAPEERRKARARRTERHAEEEIHDSQNFNARPIVHDAVLQARAARLRRRPRATTVSATGTADRLVPDRRRDAPSGCMSQPDPRGFFQRRDRSRPPPIRRQWNFVSAAGSIDSLPPMAGTEIAFAGRSNVGKSSLINALTGRRALARTSNTPGRTQELIFFGGPPARAGRHAGLRLCGRGQEQDRCLDELDYKIPPRPHHAGARLSSGRRTPWAQGRRPVDPRHAERGRGQPPDRSHQMRPDRRYGIGRADRCGRRRHRQKAGGFSAI